MGWESWVARIGGYAAAPYTGGASIPIGEAIAQGINAKDAAKKATSQQQTATNQASGQLSGAQGISGDVYNQQMGTAADVYNRQQATNGQVLNQQRSDYQSQANAPLQALGDLLGVKIGDVGASPITNQAPMKAGTLDTLTNPMGLGAGLTVAKPGQTIQAGTPANPNGTLAPAAAGTPIKPNDMSGDDWGKLSVPERQQVAQKQSTSGYETVQGPDGSMHNLPKALADALKRVAGAKAVA